MAYEENLILKTAWLYYFENMTQQEISEHLGLSRMKVIKLLEKAKRQGIVQFKIRTDGKRRMGTEKILIQKYGLKDAYIIPTPKNNINESLAKGAAQYIEANIPPDCYINIGYGDTVSRTVSKLFYSLESNVSFVSLSGGVSYYVSSMIAGAHKRDSNKATPDIYLIPAPLFASSADMAEGILKEGAVKEIMNMSELAYMTIVGIGAVSENAMVFKDNKISHNDLVMLRMKGAVGDILSQFYDKNGNKIDCDIHKRIIGTQIDTLKNFKNVMAVAGGPEKVMAIHAALTAGYVDILFTDEDTAEELINK